MVRVRGCAVRKPADRVSNYECHSERSRRIFRPTDGKARPADPRSFRLRECAGREVGLGMTKALRGAPTGWRATGANLASQHDLRNIRQEE